MTATITSVSTGEVSEQGDAAVAPIRFQTNIFGELAGDLSVPISDDQVAWTPNLVYPGLTADERLSRRTRAPGRAAILATDRSPLAEGPAAARTVGTAALAVVGEVGAPSRAQARELSSQGFPPGTLTGTSGLELAFNERLAGRPGGQLLAVSAADENKVDAGRVLATTEPVRGKAVRTAINPDVQDSAVAALGATYGGAAVLDAKTGDVLGLAGLAYSAPQPPGSTFKIITATGALDAGIVKTSDEFPVESSNSEIGREIPNAHDELCGGSFAESFAESCNTVFAPLGARLGGEKLVDDRRAVRVQLAAGALRRGDDRDRRPAAEFDPDVALGERRDRGVRDRPGPGACDAARDGRGLADDRQQGRPIAERDRPQCRPRAARRPGRR